MTRALRSRAREALGIRDLPKVLKDADEFARRFNEPAHGVRHREHIVVYTSRETLDTTAGTKFYSPYSGSIKWIKVNVSGAPSGADFKLDLLLDADSMLDASNYITVFNGDTWSYTCYPDIVGVRGLEDHEPTSLRFQINTVAGATGPFVAYIGMQVED